MSGMLLGVDLGSTTFKAVACDLSGREVSLASTRTPWARRRGAVTMSARGAESAIATAISDCLARTPRGPILSVGITGMAESGFLVDPSGRIHNEAYAWSEPHGEAEATQMTRSMGADAFSTRTGLPLSPRCSAIKSRWMTTRSSQAPSSLSWESLPEWFARVLTGQRVSELSLAARTGLLDIHQCAWDPDLITWAGLDLHAMPTPMPAGTLAGRASGGHPRLSDAQVTVAGHDHLCAAVGVGAINSTDALDSLGTGEAVMRTTKHALDRTETLRVVQAGLTIGIHVLPTARVLMAGLGMGRRLQRVLQALDVPSEDRAVLDAAALRSSPAPVTAWLESILYDDAQLPDLVIGNDENEAAVWRTALLMSAHACRNALDKLEAFVGGHHRLLASGGWYRSRPVTALRQEILGTLEVPPVKEATGRGAALIAGLTANLYSSFEHLPQPPARGERSHA